MRSYYRLNPDKVIQTIQQLNARISERFPTSGLNKVCKELSELAAVTSERANAVAQPNVLLRTFVSLIMLLGLCALGYIIYILPPFKQSTEGFAFFQSLDAVLNILVLTGAAMFSLWTWEQRYKRKKSLEYLNELNAITHVIDMHQLTKDPTVILSGGPRTNSSPKREMSEFELTRYLDYCSEMLSLTAKLAAFYSQNFHDPAVLTAVKDIEQLTTNMSRKIWQKIILAQNNNNNPLIANETAV